jgi:DNA helicase II / ATP-dependent DNA helicase PcrA
MNIVVAGPGTGKTETLVAKTAAILAAHGHPLVVTFTRAAAAELVKRLGALRHHATVKTCHALAFQLFRQYGGKGSVRRRLFHSGLERDAVLRRVQAQWQRQSAQPLPWTMQELSTVIHRGKIAGPQTADEAAVLALYAQIKGPQRLDFQDLLLETTALLQAHPAWLTVYQQRFSHVLVDEAQDLDPLQARFIAQFVPPHDALTLFLDPDQAIYGFAGADPAQTMPLFANVTPRTVIALRPNYRSRAPILQSALTLIEHNPNGQEGHTRLLVPTRTGSTRPGWFRVPNEMVEAQRIADTVVALQQHGIALHDILCLFRTNAYRTPLEITLTQRGLPFYLVQSSQEWHPTYLEWAVRPVTALLLAAHASAALPADLERAALRLYVDAAVLDRLCTRGEVSLEHVAASCGDRAVTGVQRYQAALDELRVLHFVPPAVLGDVVLSLLRQRDSSFGHQDAMVTSALRGLAMFSSLAEFVAHIKQLLALRQTPMTERVRLSTIHRAKGTQSRFVIVLGAAEGVFPLLHVDSDLAEERRLCFVALTRAQDGLLVSAPRAVQGRTLSPSRFVHEARCQRVLFPTVARLVRRMLAE